MVVEKQCRLCHEVKPARDFYPAKPRPDGLRAECRVCSIAKVKGWRDSNRDKWRAMKRAQYARNREKCIKKVKANYAVNRVRIIEQKRQVAMRLKREVFAHYGTSCYCCGESNLAFLNLDHINNDGGEFRRERGGGASTYRWAKQMDFPEGLQTACFNCNMARANNNGICPHEVEREALKAAGTRVEFSVPWADSSMTSVKASDVDAEIRRLSAIYPVVTEEDVMGTFKRAGVEIVH
jgi:hypothetical protein